jgi:thymidylate synthase (FAD)
MGKLVRPEVYLIGETCIDPSGMHEYLKASGNLEFLEAMQDASNQGVTNGEILCSFYAKLCYASLTEGKNKNVTRVRGIPGNFKAILDSGHGSVLEHCQLNFVARNVSRVFTHELVRHRVGSAFSQTSGRYVRGDEVDIVFDPILEPVRHRVEHLQRVIEEYYQTMVGEMKLDAMTDFDQKKKVTSALRRVLPNGQSNEIGFSLNLRSLRHTVQMRTAAGAEWEIRTAFADVYRHVKARYPLIFCDAREREVDGILEVYGMKMNPYEAKAEG